MHLSELQKTKRGKRSSPTSIPSSSFSKEFNKKRKNKIIFLKKMLILTILALALLDLILVLYILVTGFTVKPGPEKIVND